MRDKNHPDKPDILVVDDTPQNLRLLTDMLQQKGYKVRPVPGGELALRAAETRPPDLVLLDVRMPDIDGYEVCRRLKSNPALAEVPVIFISALNETVDKLEGFRAGGVDYVTKPFQFEEVDARLRTHIELRRHRKTVQNNYERLKELEELRDNLVKMVVHDMRSPLGGLMGFLDLFSHELDPHMNEEQKRYLGACVDTANALNRMIEALLDVSRLESGRMPLAPARHDLVPIAHKALRSLGGLCSGRALDVACDGAVEAYCDADVVERIMANLVGNALKFTPSRGGKVTVRIEKRDAHARCEVADNGPGIPKTDRERIFEKFAQAGMRLEGHKHSTGLGLTFCKLAVEAQDGTMGVDSEPGRGSTFWFTLPVS
jgi:two-component system sensor histidine kinase/response regulator